MTVQQLVDAPWVETIRTIGRDQAWVIPVTGPGQPAQPPGRMPLTVSVADLADLIQTATRAGSL